MKYKIRILFILLGIISQVPVRAQDVLTLEEAVRIALENNYNIRLVRNNLAIDRNNVTIGNAGMLPAVNGTLNNNNSIQNTRQTLSNGNTQERNGARNSNLNYGVGLSWTIFNGFGMFARYDQLQEFEKLGEKNLELTVLAQVADIIGIYYDLAQQQQQLRALDTAIAISKLRVETAQNRFTIGRASRLEVLNAQVDFNTDTTNMLRQIELYNNTQTQLNELLARDVTARFRVTDSIAIDTTLQLSEMVSRAQQQNPSLQAAIVNRRISELDLKQVRANRYPLVTLNSGYNFTEARNPLGFATQTNGRGFNYGLGASINIFNGFNQRRNEQNAKILIDNADLEYQRVNQNIQSQITSAYQTYLTSMSLVKLEENNQRIAHRNLEITMDKFRLGTITPLEVREAQLNYVNASLRYTNAQFEAKLAEVFLKELSGSITF